MLLFKYIKVRGSRRKWTHTENKRGYRKKTISRKKKHRIAHWQGHTDNFLEGLQGNIKKIPYKNELSELSTKFLI